LQNAGQTKDRRPSPLRGAEKTNFFSIFCFSDIIFAEVKTAESPFLYAAERRID